LFDKRRGGVAIYSVAGYGEVASDVYCTDYQTDLDYLQIFSDDFRKRRYFSFEVVEKCILFYSGFV